MTILARMQEDEIFYVELSKDKKTLVFHGEWTESPLDKRDMDELIGELTDLRNQMEYEEEPR